MNDPDHPEEAYFDMLDDCSNQLQQASHDEAALGWLLAEARWYAEWADPAGLPRYVTLPWKTEGKPDGR